MNISQESLINLSYISINMLITSHFFKVNKMEISKGKLIIKQKVILNS